MAAGATFRTFAGVLSVEHDRLQVVALQTAGLETAAAIVGSLGNRPLVETSTTIQLSTGSVILRISDDGGRIDVGKAPEEVLAGLFGAIGVPQVQAANVAHAIVAWRNQVNGSAGARQPPSSDAVNISANERPFTDLSQLAQIPGFLPTWLEQLAPLATVVGNETVNPLSAPAEVIAALPGIDQGRLEAFLQMRRAFPTDVNRVLATLGPSQRYVKTANRQAITILISATLIDGFAAAARAVIVLLPQDVEPYRVLMWTPARWGRSGKHGEDACPCPSY
jgi:hypothetical protein